MRFFCLLVMIIPLNCYSDALNSLTFSIHAHVSTDILGYGITKFNITPNHIETIYNPDTDTFNDASSDMEIVTNIPSERGEIFSYNLRLSKNIASCTKTDGSITDYTPPEIFINKSDGNFVKLDSNLELELSNTTSDFKSDDRKINIKYSKFDPIIYLDTMKYCSGKIELMVGLL
ncbi:TPA: hypothetical protein ACX6RT_003781 [Photobacterium damselae]